MYEVTKAYTGNRFSHGAHGQMDYNIAGYESVLIWLQIP